MSICKKDPANKNDTKGYQFMVITDRIKLGPLGDSAFHIHALYYNNEFYKFKTREQANDWVRGRTGGSYHIVQILDYYEPTVMAKPIP